MDYILQMSVSHQSLARKHMFLQIEYTFLQYVLKISFDRLENTVISQ